MQQTGWNDHIQKFCFFDNLKKQKERIVIFRCSVLDFFLTIKYSNYGISLCLKQRLLNLPLKCRRQTRIKYVQLVLVI